MAAVVTSSAPLLTEQSLSLLFGWGWIIAALLLLWIIWEVYKTLRTIDYVSSIEWSYLQIALPESATQTPKAMENIFEVLAGIEKSPDLVERYFEGFMEPWYSCEILCQRGKAQYILVVPAAHRKFFEGVIYGQYPTAEIREIADYSLRFSWRNIDKGFDMWGSEITLTEKDIFPIKTYLQYEDALTAEDERFIDPHQAFIESFTNIEEGEEFWIQVLIRPAHPKVVKQWADKGEKVINKLAGKQDEPKTNILGALLKPVLALPQDLARVAINGPAAGGAASKKFLLKFPVTSPADDERMKGILMKTSRGGFKTKIRVIHIAPAGQLKKPSYAKAIGAFKQFNTFNLNSFAPDPTTRTNKPEFFLKEFRRYQRKRRVFLNYQWRDFWGVDSGFMLNSEELATLYHFPVIYMKAPAIERSKAGLGSAPENVPYV